MRRRLFEHMKLKDISPIAKSNKSPSKSPHLTQFTPTQPPFISRFDGEIPAPESPINKNAKPSSNIPSIQTFEREYMSLRNRHEEYRKVNLFYFFFFNQDFSFLNLFNFNKALLRQEEILQTMRNSADQIYSRIVYMQSLVNKEDVS